MYQDIFEFFEASFKIFKTLWQELLTNEQFVRNNNTYLSFS